jgi:hypothetical protein
MFLSLSILIYVCTGTVRVQYSTIRDILSISPILQNQNQNSVRSAKIQIQNLLFRNGDVKHFFMTTFEI